MSEFSFRRNVQGDWCVRAWDAPDAKAGDKVQVRKSDDFDQEVTLGECLGTQGRARLFAIDKPKRPDDKTIRVYDAGVYESDEGIFVVKPNQAKTRLYAKRLVETPDRLNYKGEHVPFDFEYDAGAIYRLKPEDRMDVERAKALAIQYGACIACGRALKAAKSVEAGIGPVCIKKFRQGVTA